MPPDTGSKPAWKTYGRSTGEQQASRDTPTATPGINQHSTLDRLTPPHPAKKNKQGTEKEHAAEGAGCWKHTGEGRRAKELISMRTFSKQRLERQKG
jgi:hypothetical protein